MRTVEATGLIYTGETGYYHPHSAFCRRRYADGDFGDSSTAAATTTSTSTGRSRNDDWDRFASLPPIIRPRRYWASRSGA